MCSLIVYILYHALQLALNDIFVNLFMNYDYINVNIIGSLANYRCEMGFSLYGKP